MTKRILAVILMLVAISCGGVGGMEAQAAALTEGFETGNLSHLPWSTGGTANWSVVTDFKHSGTYSARAPISTADPDVLSPTELSYLETKVNLLTTQNISFWYKVSSEECFDFLNFYIDDVLKSGHSEPKCENSMVSGWSGEIGWTQVTYTGIPAGNHTFRWEYTKDGSGKSGSDTAWIDDISFPNASTILSYAITSPGAISNGSISCVTPVNQGSNSLCTITPNPGYHLDPPSFTDNGVVVPVTDNSYTITNVQGIHTIDGTFVLDAPSDVETFETGDLSKFPWHPKGIEPNRGVAGNWSVTTGRHSGIYGGSYAASSPSLADNQASYIETLLNIPAPGVMSFWLKVSSEQDYDYLRFYIDDIEQTHDDPVTHTPVYGWSGEIDWTLAQFPIDKGTHAFRWEYVKDANGLGGSDRAWIDDVVFPGAVYKPTYSITVQNTDANGSISCIPVTVPHGSDSVCTIAANKGYQIATLSDNGDAKLASIASENTYIISKVVVDHTITGTFKLFGNIEDFETGNLIKFPWSTGGSTDSTAWSVTSSGHSGVYGGIYAAETPTLVDNQSSYLETTQNVPLGGGNISFWFRLSSEIDSDFLKFYIDGVNVDGALWSGEVDWTQASYPVQEGTHIFRWEYSKNSVDIIPSQFDKAWIDDIVFPGTVVDFPVKIERGGASVIYKSTLQDAYDVAISADIIKLKSVPDSGGLDANQNISVFVKGGFDDTFTSNATSTSVGPLSLKAGAVRVERVTVK